VNLAVLLANASRCYPDRPALSVGHEVLFDYATMGDRVGRLAGGLRYGLGLRPGDRVALAMKNCPEYLEFLFACWHAGLVVAPLNAKLHPRELAFMAEDCSAALILSHAQIVPDLAPLLPDVRRIEPGSPAYLAMLDAQPLAVHPCDPADLAWLFYTSGTTGQPKGAMLSHRNLMAMAVGYFADVDQLTEHDALLHVAATSHASGLFALSFVAKAGHNILPASGGYEPAEMAALIDATPNLTFFVPPTLLRRMVADPAIRATNRANIRTILVGAAPVYAEDLKSGLSAFGPKLWNGYGQGESPCTITAMSKAMIAEAAASGNNAELASVGIPRTGIEVRIAGDDGRSLSAGQIGEVLVRGETVMAGYWNRPEESAEALKGGWLHTGDLGCMDLRGRLTLLDRKKDLIISGGANIYAREVEEALLSHPGVAEVAVIGLPDEEWGESVAAVIVRRVGEPCSIDDLEARCLYRIARFKRPKRYEFIDELPRNAAGKVLKRQLRERYGGRMTGCTRPDCSTIL
jgi:long-chain acyl-CoA synthetase